MINILKNFKINKIVCFHINYILFQDINLHINYHDIIIQNIILQLYFANNITMPNKKQKNKNYNITYVKCIIFYSSFFNAVIK